tara:strand:- start:145 stop:423 length:279 start_codon:yes stop_codon:yes gene_type:complete
MYIKKQRKALVSYVEDNKTKCILYRTKILEYNHADNTIMLNSGGYKTKHTKNCINDNLPSGYRVFQKNFTWHLDTPNGTINFNDNMIVNLGE